MYRLLWQLLPSKGDSVQKKSNAPSQVILARYGLDGRKDAQMVHSNALNEDTQDELGDPRLEKLWHKVPPPIFPLVV